MITNGSADSGEDQRSPWTQPGFIASAVVVGLVIVLGLVLTVTSGSQGEAGTPAPPAADSSPPAPPADTGDDSACGLARGDQTIPVSAPKATWKLRGTVAVPTAPKTFGPGRVRDGVPSCFARSPTGALFAMLNIQAAMGQLAREPRALSDPEGRADAGPRSRARCTREGRGEVAGGG